MTQELQRIIRYFIGRPLVNLLYFDSPKSKQK